MLSLKIQNWQQFYNAQLKGKLNLARVKFIPLVVCSLCKVQTATFDKLANSFAQSGSSLRPLKRHI